jgi:hypothetical protein
MLKELRNSARTRNGGEQDRAADNLRAFRARCSLTAGRPLRAAQLVALASELCDGLSLAPLSGARRSASVADELDTERALLLLYALLNADPRLLDPLRARLPHLLLAHERLAATDGGALALLQLCARLCPPAPPDDNLNPGRRTRQFERTAGELHAAFASALPALAARCARGAAHVRAAFGRLLGAWLATASADDGAAAARASEVAVAAAWAWARVRGLITAEPHGNTALARSSRAPLPAALGSRCGDRLVLVATARALAAQLGSAAGPERGGVTTALNLARALALEAGASARALSESALELCLGDDSCLVDLLAAALALAPALAAASALRVAEVDDVAELAASLCPFRLFARVLALTGSHVALLTEWLMGAETGERCAAWLLALCRAAQGAAAVAPSRAAPACAELRAVGPFLARLAERLEALEAGAEAAYPVGPLVRRLRAAAALDWVTLATPPI